MIAYAFWHCAGSGVAEAEYEAALGSFVRALSSGPSEGLRRCVSLRFEALPWVAGQPAYQDWYELDGTAELDGLERGAVSGELAAPHHAVARLAGSGTGGLFRQLAGGPGEGTGEDRLGGAAAAGLGAAVTLAWLDKPAGEPYSSFIPRLSRAAGPATAVWQRRLSLGPGREFCLWLPVEPAGDPPAAEPAGRRPLTELLAGLPAGALVVRGRVVAA